MVRKEACVLHYFFRKKLSIFSGEIMRHLIFSEEIKILRLLREVASAPRDFFTQRNIFSEEIMRHLLLGTLLACFIISSKKKKSFFFEEIMRRLNFF